MAEPTDSKREGNLEAPTRHPLGQDQPGFWDPAALEAEQERVFHICHGCRRCVSLCQAFPTLFDLVDASPTLEVDGVAKADYARVTEQCYLCDLCYQTKCPYTPPHPWNVDFPHLMLRAKAVRFRQQGAPLAARILASTRAVGRLTALPGVAQAVNAANRQPLARQLLQSTLGVHAEARLPTYHAPSARQRLRHLRSGAAATPAGRTSGKLAIFATCYCDHAAPAVVEDLAAILAHNAIPTCLVERESCCGMPRLELGDLDTVRRYKEDNIPVLARMAREGWDFTAAVPSCVLMFKQELPLLFPADTEVELVRQHFFDPFEYLMERHRAGLLDTAFRQPLGRIAWHVACHQRVQKIGPKTREILELVPGTEIVSIERCSGHDGTYGVKRATYPLARKLAAPVEKRVVESAPQHFVSDCPMAAGHIAHGLDDQPPAEHPLSLLRQAYGI